MSQTADERVQTFRDAVNASPELPAKITADECKCIKRRVKTTNCPRLNSIK